MEEIVEAEVEINTTTTTITITEETKTIIMIIEEESMMTEEIEISTKRIVEIRIKIVKTKIIVGISKKIKNRRVF